MGVQKFVTSRFDGDRLDFDGDKNRLFYEEGTFEFFYGDGETLGGIPLELASRPWTAEQINIAITNLIDGAPAVLDTLNEIAQALGDDPNYYTNIQNQLDNKINIGEDALTTLQGIGQDLLYVDERGNTTTIDLSNLAGAVQEVNGYVGIVELNTDDIPEGTNNLYYTEARALASFTYNLSNITTDDITEGTINQWLNETNLATLLENGNIQQIILDTSNTGTQYDPGTITWDAQNNTINIYHEDGIVQQVGQEQFALVFNTTGATIPKGTMVGYAGVNLTTSVTMDVAPYLADGTRQDLRAIGVTAQDILDNDFGIATMFGRVEGVDTTGAPVGETWAQGDILYAHPTIPGGLTKVKPTTPNNVIQVGIALTIDAVNGDFFVRPVIEQQMSYGNFIKVTDAIATAINTPYVLTLDATTAAKGVTLDPTTQTRIYMQQSGLYRIDLDAQMEILGGGASEDGVMSMWIRKNGVDVPFTTRRQGINSKVPGVSFTHTKSLSLQAGDYIEVVYLVSSTLVVLDSTPATTNSPSTASLLVNITQVQL